MLAVVREGFLTEQPLNILGARDAGQTFGQHTPLSKFCWCMQAAEEAVYMGAATKATEMHGSAWSVCFKLVRASADTAKSLSPTRKVPWGGNQI